MPFEIVSYKGQNKADIMWLHFNGFLVGLGNAIEMEDMTIETNCSSIRFGVENFSKTISSRYTVKSLFFLLLIAHKSPETATAFLAFVRASLVHLIGSIFSDRQNWNSTPSHFKSPLSEPNARSDVTCAIKCNRFRLIILTASDASDRRSTVRQWLPYLCDACRMKSIKWTLGGCTRGTTFSKCSKTLTIIRQICT